MAIELDCWTDVLAEDAAPLVAAWPREPHAALVRVADHWLRTEYGVRVDPDQIEAMLAEAAEAYEPPDLCEPRDGCPDCGNRNKDELVWDDDDRLTCAVCGCEYTSPASGQTAANGGQE